MAPSRCVERLLASVRGSVDGIREQLRSHEASDGSSMSLVIERTPVVMVRGRSGPDADSNKPGLPPPAAAPGDSTVLGRGASATRDVLTVPLLGDRPEVDSAIVEFVAVDVVAFQAISGRQAQQRSMQRDLAATLRTHGVAVRVQGPPPLVDPLRINGVNDGVRADRPIATAQRDQDGIIKLRHGDLQVLRGVTPRTCQALRGISMPIVTWGQPCAA